MSYDLKRLPALIAVLGLAAACGKEGPPTPPLRAVPAPVKDLAVHQRGTHVLLSFKYPQTTPGGAALNGVSKVEVWEAVLPAATPPSAAAKPAAKGASTPPAKGAAGPCGHSRSCERFSRASFYYRLSTKARFACPPPGSHWRYRERGCST